MPTSIDHLFVLAFAVAYPVAGLAGYRKLLARERAGIPVNRIGQYRMTMAAHWTLFAVGLAIWAKAGRPWPELGFSFTPDLYFAIGAAGVAIAIGYLIHQLRSVANADTETLAALGSQLEGLRVILPHTRGELRHFYGVAVAAGVVEETLWRGFLLFYLQAWMPLWAAAVVSTLAFGLGHAYQGWARLPAVTLVGAVMMGLFLLTGSLWLPIILHAAIDLLQGRLTFEFLKRDREDPAVT